MHVLSRLHNNDVGAFRIPPSHKAPVGHSPPNLIKLVCSIFMVVTQGRYVGVLWPRGAAGCGTPFTSAKFCIKVTALSISSPRKARYTS